jgi:hypothetical protein
LVGKRHDRAIVSGENDALIGYARAVDAAERTVYHQIHPAKLATDVLAEVISVRLLWQRHLAAGLVVHLVPSVVASAILTRRTAALEWLKATPAGRYVRAEMTPPMVALRVLGDVITVVGAWRRQPLVIEPDGIGCEPVTCPTRRVVWLELRSACSHRSPDRR